MYTKTNPGRLVAQATKFHMVEPNIFSVITASVFPPRIHKSTCIRQKAPRNSKVLRSGASVWNLHVTLPAPKIWRGCLDFLKSVEP
jgi:hypothetical protein